MPPLPPPFRDSDAYAELDAVDVDEPEDLSDVAVEMPTDDTLEVPFTEQRTPVTKTCPHCGLPLP